MRAPPLPRASRARFVQRRGPPDVVTQQPIELRRETRDRRARGGTPRSSASIGATSVSGTNRPPNAPKYPRASGSRRPRSCSCSSSSLLPRLSLHRPPDLLPAAVRRERAATHALVCVLQSGRQPPRPTRRRRRTAAPSPTRLADVLRREPAGEQRRGRCAARLPPHPSRSRCPVPPRRTGSCASSEHRCRPVDRRPDAAALRIDAATP